MGYPSPLQSCWPGTERHGSFVFCSETSGLAEQKLQGVSSVIISITHHLLGDVPDEGGSFGVKIQTEVRGERPLNFPEIINLLSMKRSCIGCHDFSLQWRRGATLELRMGLAALLQGQEPLPGLRLAGPRDNAPSDNQRARACRHSSGAPDPSRRLFSICSIQAMSAG